MSNRNAVLYFILTFLFKLEYLNGQNNEIQNGAMVSNSRIRFERADTLFFECNMGLEKKSNRFLVEQKFIIDSFSYGYILKLYGRNKSEVSSDAIFFKDRNIYLIPGFNSYSDLVLKDDYVIYLINNNNIQKKIKTETILGEIVQLDTVFIFDKLNIFEFHLRPDKSISHKEFVYKIGLNPLIGLIYYFYYNGFEKERCWLRKEISNDIRISIINAD